MGVYTRAELTAQLSEIQSAISKVITSQAYTTASGAGNTRALYRDLCTQRERLMQEIDALDAENSLTGGCGGLINKVQFGNPE